MAFRIQKVLGGLRPEYDRRSGKLPDCNEMVGRVIEAERRAEGQLCRRELHGTAFGNPSTTVGDLTRSIREASELAHEGK